MVCFFYTFKYFIKGIKTSFPSVNLSPAFLCTFGEKSFVSTRWQSLCVFLINIKDKCVKQQLNYSGIGSVGIILAICNY